MANDEEQLKEAFVWATNQAYVLTHTKDKHGETNEELYKTTFNAIFWEFCHYLFGMKLDKDKMEQRRIADLAKSSVTTDLNEEIASRKGSR